MTISKEDMLTLDPELQAIFTKNGTPRRFLPTSETLPKFRESFNQATKRHLASPFARSALEADKPPTWTEEDHVFAARDGASIPIRVYRPKSHPASGLPVMVVFHGGRWSMGDLDTESFLCQLICHRLRIVVFNVAYRLYPDAEFPVPVTDCYDAVKWVAHNATTLGGNCGRGFILGGNSGGATFASIAAHLARDDGMTPKLTGQFLACPVLTDEVEDGNGKTYRMFPGRYPSQEENRTAKMQNRADQDQIAGFSQLDLASPYATPFLFPSHAGLPPVYTQVCGLDPWRDGGIIYNDLVQEAGSKSKIDIYAGMPHCWWGRYPMVSRTEKWREDTVNGVRWLLAQGNVDAGKTLSRL